MNAVRALDAIADRLPAMEAALSALADRATPAYQEALLGERASLEGSRRRLRALALGLTLSATGRPPESWGGLTVDPEAARCTWRGEPVTLTRRQVDVLYELVRARGELVSRGQLTHALYGPQEVKGRAVEQVISRVRAGLAAAGAEGIIENTWGAGWRLAEEQAVTV